MVDIRGFNGGLNTDASPELLPNGDYTYAMNVSNGPEGIANLLGNRLLPGAPPPTNGTDWVCGSFFDKKRQRIIYFTHNNLGYHRIISADIQNNIYTVLFEDIPSQVPVNQSFTSSRSMIINNLTTPQNLFIISGINLNLIVGDTFSISGSTNNNGTFTITAFNYSLDSLGTQLVNYVYVSQNTIFETGTFNITYNNITNVISGVFNWDIYSFYEPSSVIKDIKVVHRDYEGDLYYFIDPKKRLLKFNYNNLFNKVYGNILKLDYFKVIKAPPDDLIICKYADDISLNSNNLQKKLFQFKYRYIYDDNEKSVWSALSKVPLADKADDGEFNSSGTRNNVIDIDFFTGDINIKKIEIASRVNIESEWSDFFLIDTLDKTRESISSNITYTYRFRNDGVYSPIDIQESNLLFDYVPDEANCLELANGNTIVVGGLKDGYDRDTVLNVQGNGFSYRTDTITSGTLLFPLKTPNGSSDFVGPVDINPNFNNPQINVPVASIPITGNQITGDIVSIKISGYFINRGTSASGQFVFGRYDFNETFSVTVSSGMSKADIISQFMLKPAFGGSRAGNSNAQTFFFSNNGPNPAIDVLYVGIYRSDNDVNRFYKFNSITISYTPASTFSGQDSISCFKWLGKYKFGIAYYDENGKTNGVYTTFDDKWSIITGKYQKFSPTIALPPVVEINISHQAPSWAKYYHLVRTKELSCDFSLVLRTESITQDTSYYYFNISCLTRHATDFPTTSSIINYGDTTFVKGDRIRILENTTTGVLPANYEYEIIGIVQQGGSGKWIKFKKASNLVLNVSHNYIIEIFRPSKNFENNDLVFYEIGERFDVYTNGSNYFHRGNFADQTSNPTDAVIRLFDGDYYLRYRTQVTNSTSGATSTFHVIDNNFSDLYLSSVWSQGRPLVVDEDIKEEYYPAMLRFSQSYIYGTNINNLSRFYPNNFEEADASFGDILRLKTRENFIRLFQRYKVAMIPIYRSIIIDNATSTQVSLSEKLLNKPNYYSGEYGIDRYGSSLVSTDYGDYFIDTINRAIVRVSLDGITNISDVFNLSVWANQKINIDSYGYGCFNYENRNVIMLVGNVDFGTSTITNNIVAYNEPDKKFESFYGFTKVQSMLFINGYIYSLYADPTFQINQGWHLYIHDNQTRNNFFGKQQTSSISTVFNGALQAKKTYTAIEELANGLWTGTVSTGPLTNQSTSLSSADFQKTVGAFVINSKENKFNATIKRDENSVGGKYLGIPMKGLYAQVALTNSLTTEQRLISVSLKYIQSPLTNS